MDAKYEIDLTSLGLTNEQIESVDRAIRKAVVLELLAFETVSLDAVSVDNPLNPTPKVIDGAMGFRAR